VSQKSQASQNDNNNLKTNESEMNIKIPRINYNSPNFQTECGNVTHSPDSAFRIDNNDNDTPQAERHQTEFKLELKDTNINHIIDQAEEEKIQENLKQDDDHEK
jgi:hypothetical protein